MAKYRKKPVEVEAVQWTGENVNEVIDFAGDAIECNTWNFFDTVKIVSLDIKTLEGVMHAARGDYIIKGVNGEFYPCKPDIFEKTYERVDEDG